MTQSAFFNLLTAAVLLTGAFFLFTGALGVPRLPDLYHRMIAASKCITLGVTGMLIAAVLHLAVLGRATEIDGHSTAASASAIGMATKAILVILFQFVAGPLGSYLLARAAHQDDVAKWHGTLADELAEDVAALQKLDGRAQS